MTKFKVNYTVVLYIPLTIQEVREEIPGFKTFYFSNTNQVKWQSGQYLTLVYHLAHEEIRRSYSIISTPVIDERLAIGVKRIENGAFSRELIDHALPGQQLLTTGAGGFFTLPASMEAIREVVFFAAGSGITPIYSLIKAVLHFHPSIHVVLLYSNPSPEKTIFLNELLALKDSFRERFQPHFFFSNEPDLRKARLNRDSILQLIKEIPIDHSLFYTCGPEAYMRLCVYTLRESGVPAENIKRENFVIDRVPPFRPQPSDKQTHYVSVALADGQHRFEVRYPDTILQAAKKEGIGLPYSCETGRCGSCAARCVSGKVWLSYNEVLTDRELAQGLTLTCVGHPVGGDVQLEL